MACFILLPLTLQIAIDTSRPVINPTKTHVVDIGTFDTILKINKIIPYTKFNKEASLESLIFDFSSTTFCTASPPTTNIYNIETIIINVVPINVATGNFLGKTTARLDISCCSHILHKKHVVNHCTTIQALCAFVSRVYLFIKYDDDPYTTADIPIPIP